MSPETSKVTKTETRYLVTVNLVAARRSTLKDSKIKEYYFETGKKTKQRTPTRGYYKFNTTTNEIKDPINLFSEIIKSNELKEIEVMLDFKEKNESVFKLDETVNRMKLGLNTGDKRQIYTLNDSNLELKIAMSINKTEL